MANPCECFFFEKFVLCVDQFKSDKWYELFKSGFKHCGLLNYSIMIDGMPVNADFIDVTTPNKYNTYSESISTLMEAWSVHHKTDGLPTLLTLDNYFPAHCDSTKGFCKERHVLFLVKNNWVPIKRVISYSQV